MRTRTLLAASIAALTITYAGTPAGAMPTPTPNPGRGSVDVVATGPTAVLDLPESRIESHHFSDQIVLDDSTGDRRRPIVEQRLTITEPDGDRTVLHFTGRPGSHAQTSVTFDEHGTWSFSLTVTDLLGRTDTATRTVEVRANLAGDPPDHDELPDM